MKQNQDSCTNKEIGELLAAYEMGLLSETEQALVENHLNLCPTCSERSWHLAPTMETLHQGPGQLAGVIRGRWWDRLRARLLIFEMIPQWRQAMPAMAAAVVVLLLLIVSGPWDRSETARLARIEPLPYVQMATRGGEIRDGADGADRANGAELFRLGMDDYIGGDYETAATQLAQAAWLLTETGTQRDQAYLFAGLSYLLESSRDSACVYLTVARESQTAVIADRARWYLAQAAFQSGDVAEARSLLEALAASSPGYGAEANRQLEQLEAVAPSR